MSDPIGDVFYDVELNDANLSKQAKQTGDKAGTELGKGMSASIQKALSGPELSRGLKQGLGIGAGLGVANAVAGGLDLIKDGFTGALTSAMSFEQGLRNVNSIAKVSDAELAAMGDSALDIGDKFGQTASTMVDAMYDINSSGFEGAEALDVLEASALAATAGMATTGEAAAGITAVLNAYGMEAEDATHVSDVLFKTVERGVVTFPQLSAEIGKTTALSAPLGISLEEVGAALAIMTRAGIDAENATTQLNAIMASILKPSKEAADLAKELGIDWTAAGLRANGLSGTLSKMIKATNGSEEAMATLLGDARAIRGAFSLAANEGANLSAELEIMEDAAGAAGAAFGEQSKGTAFKVAQAQARMERAGIEIGQRFLPILADLAEFVSTEVVPAIEGVAAALDLLNGKLPETEEGFDALKSFVNFFNVNPLTALTGSQFENVVDQIGAAGKESGRFSDGLNQVAHSARHVKTAATESFDAVGDSAEEMGDAALRGATDLRTAVDGVINGFKILRDEATKAGGGAASALYDPIIAQLQFVETQEELRANRKELRDQSITDAERRQLEIRNAELNKSLIEQQSLILTYGTEAEQISKTKAFLTSSFWTQAYEQATPEQAAALDAWKLQLEGRLTAMEGSAEEGGRDLREGFIGELQKGGPATTAAINTWSSAADKAYARAKADALAAGKGTGAAYAAGLRASYGLVQDAAYYVGRAIGPLKPSSPPPAVPWIIDAGTELGEMWAEGIVASAKAARDAAMALGSAFGSGLGANAPGYSLAGAVSAPTAGAVALGGAAAVASGVAGNRTYEYHIHAEGQLKVPDPLAAANLLARFQGTGLLPEAEDD